MVAIPVILPKAEYAIAPTSTYIDITVIIAQKKIVSNYSGTAEAYIIGMRTPIPSYIKMENPAIIHMP